MGNFQTLRRTEKQFYWVMTSQCNVFKFQLEIKEEAFASLFFSPETMLKIDKQWDTFSTLSATDTHPLCPLYVEVRLGNTLRILDSH